MCLWNDLKCIHSTYDLLKVNFCLGRGNSINSPLLLLSEKNIKDKAYFCKIGANICQDRKKEVKNISFFC